MTSGVSDLSARPRWWPNPAPLHPGTDQCTPGPLPRSGPWGRKRGLHSLVALPVGSVHRLPGGASLLRLLQHPRSRVTAGVHFFCARLIPALGRPGPRVGPSARARAGGAPGDHAHPACSSSSQICSRCWELEKGLSTLTHLFESGVHKAKTFTSMV